MLRGHETILHRVRDSHAVGEIDDSRRSLQRVCRAHACFELFGCGVVTFQGKETRRQDLHLALGLHPEQVEHRELTEIVCAHPTDRCSVRNNR